MRTLALIALLLGGCALKPTENQKELHQQTIGAADFAERTSTEPAVKQAAADAKLTAQTTQDTLIGPPKEVKPYSHAEVVKVVEIVKKEYDESQAPWYKRWAGTLLTGLSVLATGLGILGYVYPPAGMVAGILKPVANTLTGMKQAADAHKDDVLSLDSLTAQISVLAKDPKIGGTLTKLLKDAHLDQLVHSPEAADPPPPKPS